MKSALDARNLTISFVMLAIALSLFFLLYNNPLTIANYNKIENGMTIEQVKKILGTPDQESAGGVGPLDGRSLVYRSSKGEVTINFINGKVVMKSGHLEP